MPDSSAECKRRSHLHARRALIQRLAQLSGIAVSARQPEGNAQRPHLRKVDPVALAVNRLSGGIELQLAARRRIVPARRRAFRSQIRPRGPLARRSMVVASVFEETMARNRGRSSDGSGPSA